MIKIHCQNLDIKSLLIFLGANLNSAIKIYTYSFKMLSKRTKKMTGAIFSSILQTGNSVNKTTTAMR